MAVLITRPEPGASRTGKAVRALGYAYLVDPLFEIVFLDPAFDPLDHYDTVLFTSQNGVVALSRLCSSADRSATAALSIGKRTDEIARKVGFASCLTASGDSDDLFDLASQSFKTDARILYATGRERTGALDERLRARGFHVDLVEVYATHPSAAFKPETLATLRRREVEHVLLYSRRAAAHFFALVCKANLADCLKQITFLCLSPAIAEVVLAEGPYSYRVASRPDEQALLNLLN